MSVDPVRDAAINTLVRVFFHGAYLSQAVDQELRQRKLSDRGRRFLTQLAFGTVRHTRLADHILSRLLNRPMEDLPRPIIAILRMGVFQALFCSQVTFPAMVHTSVDLGRKWGHAGLARLVNAVLRRAPKKLEDVRFPDREREPIAYLGVRYSLPDWLVEAWQDEFGPEEAEALCAASNEEAPVTVRANTLRCTAEDLIEKLVGAGLQAVKRTPIPEEVTLLDGPPPARSKAFGQGDFLIQDGASMLPPHLLEPKAGERVLDLCAAPGGKTTHLAQLAEGKADIVALDRHAGKLRMVRSNVERLGAGRVAVACADGRYPPLSGGFDRVLVDAPCSGLGTLRRRPDLRWRLTPEDIEELGQLQGALLRSAIGLCKNGGLIVFSVCTIGRRETIDVIDGVIEQGGVAPEDGPEWLNPWKIAEGRYRTSPRNQDLDGFFLTRLRKQS